ncbi:MAG TPA: MarR family transcriptional regulator [Gemmatales bacterium]|nr:MarR family transcriptional regulator [Gemmatales bacterium]
MLKHEVDSSIGYWAFVVFRDFERALNEELAPHGITLRQSQVLSWLALRKELTQAELAELMRLEPPTLVRILDRMERDGWIGRHAVENDRRKKLIRPTRQVEPVWRKVRQCIQRVRARARRGIQPNQVEQTLEVLSAIHSNLHLSEAKGAAHS